MSGAVDDTNEGHDLPATPAIADAPIHPTCPGCGYDLSGTLESPDQRCPECGRTWTVEELALQHIVCAGRPSRSNRFVSIFTPGLTVGGLFMLGLIFGPPVNWIAFPSAVVLVVLAVVEWGREQYQNSFSRARSPFNRFAFVVGRTAALVIFNIIFVVAGSLLTLLLFTSCNMASLGLS